MDFTTYLEKEWKPALGCTEPASIAWAASTAAAELGEEPRSIRLVCDPRIYKNCYAVGIPYSGHRVGIRWALAIGAHLPDPAARLECFRQIDEGVLARAGALLETGAVRVEVDSGRDGLLVDCRIAGVGGGEVRAVIEREHTAMTSLTHDGKVVSAAASESRAAGGEVRAELARLGFADLLALARSIGDADRETLHRGVALNRAIAEHGRTLFPRRFVDLLGEDPLTRISQLVCAGVYARMWGEDFTVMSLAGSGNKGIVCAVPLGVRGREAGIDPRRVDEALALACLMTSATTHHLGSLSAVCGCSNAAGIGLAAGLVHLAGGGVEDISRAVNNMVGNVTGMICDGAKIGCALKTMTSVDAAFRSASLAMDGIGIPASDGIIGEDGVASLANLGRIATRGMIATDGEILAIMQEKLRREPAR